MHDIECSQTTELKTQPYYVNINVLAPIPDPCSGQGVEVSPGTGVIKSPGYVEGGGGRYGHHQCYWNFIGTEGMVRWHQFILLLQSILGSNFQTREGLRVLIILLSRENALKLS